MTRLLARSLASVALLAAALSCRDAASPADDSRGTATLALAPAFVTDGVATQPAPSPITRIRLTATQVSDGVVIDTETITVNPNDAEWSLNFSIALPPGSDVSAVVTIELLGDGGTVEWSGMTAPFVLTSGPIASPLEVPVFRGPLANLGVTSVNIAPDAPSIEEGSTVALSAEVIGGTTETVVFWTSLDSDKATVAGNGVVTGIAPGTARIVATVGSRSDTITVTITVRVATIQVSPPSASLASIGATAAFTARALDPRNAEVPGVTITFSVAPANVASHTGGGVMRAEGNGTATVTATGRGVSGTATLTVAQVPASVVVSPPAASIPTIGGTTTFTAVVRDANQHPIVGAAVTWTSAPTNVATVGTTTGVVTAHAAGVATITARASATVTGTGTVVVGAQTFFTDGFEGTFNWTAGGIANRTNGVGIMNTASPTYVTLPGGSSLPPAAEGSFYLWFGHPSSGNYMGPQNQSDFPNSGGTSLLPQSGAATSPAFSVPAGIATAYLHLRTWFEIESEIPQGFDLMIVEVIDANTGQVVGTATLNTNLQSGAGAEFPTTSGGLNVPPVFVPMTFVLNNVAGRSLRVRFSFETGDESYNGFRGWIIDDVRVNATPPVAPGAGAGAAASGGGATIAPVPMRTCGDGGCVRAVPPVRRR